MAEITEITNGDFKKLREVADIDKNFDKIN